MQGAGAEGPRNMSVGGGGGGGAGGATAVVTSATNSPSLAATFRGEGGGGEGGGARSTLRRRFTSTYSLVVGEDVDEVEGKFKATLDSEVQQYKLFRSTI